jgi:AcrR family transcriptional regulator
MSPAAASPTTASPTAAARPLRQDAARNRKLLLLAARKVFGQDGLGIGVEAVAREAGVGTGTLYRHFPSKDDLITALIDDLSAEVLEIAQTTLARADGTGLWDFLHATGAKQAENQGLLYRLWVGAEPARLDAIRALITGLVADAHEHGTLVASVEQPDIILLLQGLRGVIESNTGGRDDAWVRYLKLATTGLRQPAH